MKPAKFDYYRPKDVSEALSLLESSGFDGKIIAGGQSLVPIMNMRLATPQCLIDINSLHDLNFIDSDDQTLKIGTMTRQNTVETSELVKSQCGLVTEAVAHIGHLQTRNRGTIGGSIVHADPSAELPLVLMALNGTLHISSEEETRTVKAEDFFLTFLTTDMMPNEMLTEIHLPIWKGRVGSSFQEVARRHGDFALVAAACQLELDAHDKISDIRLALGGVEAIPLLIEDAKELLAGEKITDQAVQKIAELVGSSVEPESDLHASATYRTQLAKVLTARVLYQAYERAKG
ncbi:FAD binding domain-containing protein [Fictibacillus terranigra]|uniref:Xanthine dehydrogenase family protein subunit M n=1 Tax=Fictibacillus terranigra TaxID=3058424 RepID=A0ABT8E5C2_9BACL|nr:xanthine dehydrogenase family protein subunit M [Fictibacillus sp. CENA-BCM004]MDN4073107.1 xanthine dehydrogenase family protein subunit M [Fictibacillus sp. CENA-BCM004]